MDLQCAQALLFQYMKSAGLPNRSNISQIRQDNIPDNPTCDDSGTHDNIDF